MGLDFSHGEVCWGYGSFTGFRASLCHFAGHGNLWDYYSTKKSFDDMDDDLKFLLNHSDCDGELTVRECEKLIVRLGELVDKFDDEDYDKIKCGLFIEAMEEAVSKNEPLEFC